MSPSERSLQSLIQPSPGKSPLLTSGTIPRQLSPAAMQLLLDNARIGERNLSRTIISLTLNVNDVVAEYCLRHLEEKLREEKDYEHRVLAQIARLELSTAHDLQSFLHYTFGVHGKVSYAISNHLRTVTS